MIVFVHILVKSTWHEISFHHPPDSCFLATPTIVKGASLSGEHDIPVRTSVSDLHSHDNNVGFRERAPKALPKHSL